MSQPPPSQPPPSIARAPGWYPDPNVGDQRRYFDGERWTPFTHSDVAKSADQRRYILNEQVQTMAARGWAVESQTDYMAIMALRRPVNHGLHAALSLLTLGFWLIVWAIVAAANAGAMRETVQVDANGNVTHRRLAQ